MAKHVTQGALGVWMALALVGACGEQGPSQLGVGATTGTGTSTTGASTPSTTPPDAGGQGATTGGRETATGLATDTTAAEPPGTGDVPASGFCEVLEVVQAKCHGCHAEQPLYGAPMSLMTYPDFTAPAVTDPAQTVTQLLGQRIHDAARPMPPQEYPPLTEAEKALVDTWVANGAPAPDTACDTGSAGDEPVSEVPVEGGEFAWPEDCEQTYEFRANDDGQPHVVAAGIEEHPQFYFDVPWSDDVQALAFRPLTDNAKVLHHWILYDGRTFVNGWAPGKEARILADNVGIFVSKDAQLRLDTHYYNLAGTTAEEDSSGVEVCVTTKFRENTAATHAFMASATVGPNQRVENESTCTVSASEPVHLIASSPHMHKLGVYAKLEVTHPDGTSDMLHDQPFDFEDQRSYDIDYVLNDGDQVTVTCIYENTTNQRVSFGQNTDDEMCFNFSLYYPMGALSCPRGGVGF